MSIYGSDGLDWRADAACLEIGHDVFFPEKGESIARAKRVCQGCPVRNQCLEFALDTREANGVWGGLSERERRNLRRARHGRAA